MAMIIYTTLENIQDAKELAYQLVEEKLVACVNIIPKIESIYRWKGKIERSKEVAMICKTKDKNVKKTIQRIKALHKYELPAIIAVPIIDGLKDYLDYIDNETL